MKRSLLALVVMSWCAFIVCTTWTNPTVPGPPTLAIAVPSASSVDPRALITVNQSDDLDAILGAEPESIPGVPAEVFLTELPAQANELTHLFRWLHVTTVRSFESAPNFGGNRMYNYTLFDEPAPPKHQPYLARMRKNENDSMEDYGYLDQNLVDGQPTPSEAWMWVNLMYGMNSRGFVYRVRDLRTGAIRLSTHNRFSFGGTPTVFKNADWRTKEETTLSDDQREAGKKLLVGVPSPFNKSNQVFYDHPLMLKPSSFAKENERLWKIQTLQLVSLLKHDPPVAYENHDRQMVSSDQRKHTREIDEFESASFDKLREGFQRVLAWNGEHERLQMVAAIRAKDHCLKCHEVKSGDLLGAFTYWIEEERKTPGETAVSQDEPK